MVPRIFPRIVLSLMLIAWRSGAAGFDGPAVWPVRIEIAAENEAKLRVKPRESVPARIQVLDDAAHEANLRLKGRGTFQPIDAKPSFTIEFKQGAGQQPAHALGKFHLNNSIEDPTYLKERIGSEMFEAAGIPTPRVGHARVTLNGKELGLYVLKEGFTDDFLKRHFAGRPGNLYDTDEGKDIDQKMELEIGWSEDQEELRRLAAAAKEADLARRWTRLQTALDLDRVLNFMAMEVMICHWDGYGLSQNNFRVYYEPERDKVLFLPAGMDQIFSKADLTWKPNMIGLVARSVLETREGKEAYERRFESLFEAQYGTTRITNRIAELMRKLEPFVSRNELAAIQSEAREFSGRIAQREISLRNQLAAYEAEFPQFKNGVALLSGWKRFDAPMGGQMLEDASALRILAGPKTAASWRKSVRLAPGRYLFRGTAGTRGVEPLPFGNRNGASLRIIGDAAQSKPLVGNSEPARIECFFEVAREEEVTLACELRASAGEAWFEKGLTLEMQQ